MKNIKAMIWIMMAAVLLPAVLADIIAPPPSYVIGAGVSVIVIALLANYAVNFAITVPVARTIAGTRIGKIAKGLLIITPIMLIAETGFFWIVSPSAYRLASFISYWLLSFLLIFVCYFITGEKIWGMNGKQAFAASSIMALITNPAYFVYALYVFF